MKQSKKSYPIANQKLDIPEKTLLLYTLKEYKVYVGKLHSEIDDLQYKNSVLVEKGKSLERELKKANKQKESLGKQIISVKKINESLMLTKSEGKEILKTVRREELYKILMDGNEKLKLKNKKLL